MRSLLQTFVFPDWETLYLAIAEKPGKEDFAGLVRACPARTPHRSRPSPKTRRPGSRPPLWRARPERTGRDSSAEQPPEARRPGCRELLRSP